MKALYKSKLSYATLAALICAIFIVSTRIQVKQEKEISWDILGYYLYLPATFIHNDFLLDDITWLETVVEEKGLADTLYFTAANKKGERMYFFLMGMSILYLPWFLIGHGLAHLLDYPPDGFTAPYVYSLIVGAVFYTLVGLWFLKKILRKFFSDYLTAFLLLIIYFGTNTVHHLIAKDLETVNMLFMLAAIVLWHTIKWHEQPRNKSLFIIAACIALMTLIKPSEILIGLLPLLYGVTGKEALKEKVNLLKYNGKSLVWAVVIGLVILTPQLIYWKFRTGHFIYDSYNNPGVGLDWWSPYLLEILFSFRKGWLIYTPVMLLALLGFIPFYQRNKKLFAGVIVYFVVSFYLMSSWTEWWYGSSFSCRPVITLYVVLAISMGYALQWVWTQRKALKISVATFVVLCIGMNLFKWWQFENWILHDSRMTKEYAMNTFFSTSVTSADLKLLEYDFSSFTLNRTENPPVVKSTEILNVDFSQEEDFIRPESVIRIGESAPYYHMSRDQEFGFSRKQKLSEVTSSKFFYLECKVTYRFPDQIPESVTPVYFNNAMENRSGIYGYGSEILSPPEKNQWVTHTFKYIAPRIRSYNDSWLIQIWNRAKVEVDIKEFKVTCNEVKSL